MEVYILIFDVTIVFKMATIQQKVFCVLEYDKTFSFITVQRAFRRMYPGNPPPGKQSILRWYNQFKETGTIVKGKSSGRPRVSNETVERVRASFVRSPQKSTYRASRELDIPQPTVWKILRTRLRMKPYRIQLLQTLKPEDLIKRFEFCNNMQAAMEDDDGFEDCLVFSDEANFHISGKVNRHNVRIWGTQQPYVTVQHERDSAKVNVFAAISKSKLYGPFFFAEKTVTGMSFLDMLEQWLLPQLTEDSNNFLLQIDGAPPHWHIAVRDYLNTQLPRRWIGRCGEGDLPFLQWPPRSPDLTACDFFFGGA